MKTIQQAVQSDVAQKWHGYAVESAGNLLNCFPPEVQCSVGVMLATEGAYRLILQEQEGIYGRRKPSSNELQSTKNLTPLPEEI
jgi:hypothetical protein